MNIPELKERLLERLLRYAAFDTRSDPESETYPSTARQLLLLNHLVEELTLIGLDDVEIDEYGYVTATVPSTLPEEDSLSPTVGFIAHVDTSPDMSGEGVRPQVVRDYDGGAVPLGDGGLVLSPEDFPELALLRGHTLVTTDGTTLLGADDKAGVAEIVTAAEYLVTHPEVRHGRIRIAFTPDEEIGRGVDHFDVARFGAAVAYTMDGGAEGELEYENFNAASARIAIRGRNIHPGMAKEKMINAIQVACELNAMLPAWERPEHTEGYEGFFHPVAIRGDVDSASMEYIIRDHSRERFEARKAVLTAAAEYLNRRYGADTVGLTLTDQYYNMRERVETCPEAVALARRAMEEVGVTPCVRPIRGGTDGARLSYMGLPCPNLFTGGANFHGRYEYCSVDTMAAATCVIVRLAELWGASRPAAASSINKN
ncbi:peptidase T [uncultured Rikenella sp.]|uniref:peptidase T n=1 Tax=uncultured Rikenella sp. TaxID=368003 RepID=UPI0025D75175|nr:peptidase T [uncultured Rikenella sp.]